MQKSGGCPLFDACSIGFSDVNNFSTEPIGMQGIYYRHGGFWKTPFIVLDTILETIVISVHIFVQYPGKDNQHTHFMDTECPHILDLSWIFPEAIFHLT
jgi:hypothetical protein